MTKEGKEFFPDIDFVVAQRQERLEKIIGQRHKLVDVIGTGEVQAIPDEIASNKKKLMVSVEQGIVTPEDFKKDSKVRRVRGNVQRRINTLEAEKERTPGLFRAAKTFIELHREKDQRGDLEADWPEGIVYEGYKEQYKKDKPFRKAVRHLSTLQSTEIPSSTEEDMEIVFELPNGKKVGDKSGQLLHMLQLGTHDQPIQTRDIVASIYPDFDPNKKSSKNKVYSLVSYAQDVVRNTGVGIKHIKSNENPRGLNGYYLEFTEFGRELTQVQEGTTVELIQERVNAIEEKSTSKHQLQSNFRPGSLQEKLYSILLSSEEVTGVSVSELALQLYDEDSDKTRERVTSNIFIIRKKIEPHGYTVANIPADSKRDSDSSYFIREVVDEIKVESPKTSGIGRGRDTGRISGGNREITGNSEDFETAADQAFKLLVNSTPEESVSIRQLLDLGLTEEELKAQRKMAATHLRLEGKKLFNAPDFQKDSDNMAYFAEISRGVKISIRLIERTAIVGDHKIELNEENSKLLGVMLRAQHPCAFLDYLANRVYPDTDKDNRLKNVKNSLEEIDNILQSSTGITDLMLYGIHPERGEFVYLKETTRDYVPDKLPENRTVALDMIARNTSTKFEIIQQMGMNRAGRRFTGPQAYRALISSYRDIRKRVFHSVATPEELALYKRFERHQQEGRNTSEMIRVKMGLKPRSTQ